MYFNGRSYFFETPILNVLIHNVGL